LTAEDLLIKCQTDEQFLEHLARLHEMFPVFLQEQQHLRTMAQCLVEAWAVPRKRPGIIVPGQPKLSQDEEVNRRIKQAVEMAVQWGEMCGLIVPPESLN
jgi:hypothetical protein